MEKENLFKTIKWVGISVAILLSLIAYRILYPPQLTKDECYRLGSNERMNACLLEIKNRSLKDVPPKEDLEFTPISDLELTSVKVDGGYTPYIYGTITNKNSILVARSIILKITFNKYGIDSCTNSLDTQYVNIAEVLLPGDSKAFREPVYTEFNTIDAFNYCYSLETAKAE